MIQFLLSMLTRWLYLIAFSLIWAAIFIVWLRTDLRAKWAALVFFTVPGIGLLCFWAAYRGRFGDCGLGLGIAIVVTVVWWLIWGRKIPPADSDRIKVWGQE
ncbi:MAG: hypothetical protein HY023_09200 [Chloroflexi bacterium]|nr:hypothetical protein [Chloroflexota bacterium]MBI3763021.1 hypothetical protein [Chloroflexota bacterium]